MGKRVTITRADGELGSIDESELPRALESGFRVVEGSEVQQIQSRREAQSTTGMLRGGGEAALRGASFGISDVVARGLGADMGQMAARKENLGTLGTVTELVGAAAPALLTGGASTAGTATGMAARIAARTPAGAVARLGTGLAARVGGGKARQMAVQGAAEGLFQGMGAAASEDALGDRDLSAERLIAGGAEGAIMGGLLGGGIGKAGDGLAAAARGGKRVGRAAMERVAGFGSDVADPAVRSAAQKGGNLVERAQHAQLGALGAGVDDHAALRHLNGLRKTKEGRKLMMQAEAGRFDDAVADRLVGSVGRTDTTKALDRFGKGFAADARKGGLHATAERFGKLKEKLGRKGFIGAEAGENAAIVRKILRRGNKKGDIFERMAKGAEGAPPNAHRYLTKTIEDIEQAMAGRESTFGHEAVMAELAPLKALADDKLIWGSKAGTARTLYAAKDLERQAIARLPKKVQAALQNPSDTTAAKLLAKNEDGVQAVLDAREGIAKTLADAGEDIGELRRGLDETKEALRYRGELEEAGAAWGRVKAVGDSPQAKAARAGIEGVGMITGGGFGGLGGAFGGRLAGEALGSATRPAAALSTLARMRQAVDLVSGKEGALVRGAERLAERGAAAAKQAARAARGVGRAGLRTGRQAAVRRRERIEQVRRSVVQMAAKPEEIGDKLGPGMNEVQEVAPGVATAMGMTAARAVAFLASKAPSAYSPPFSTMEIVDDAALDQFERYVRAVEDPLGAVKALERGALAIESVEALRVVYPKIYGSLQDQTLEMVAKRSAEGRPVSFEAREQLGMLLSIPLEQALVPGFRDRLMTQGAQGEQPQQAPEAPDVRASANVEPAASAETGLTRLEAGGERR